MKSLQIDGYLIRFRRERLGESQQQFAARIGITGSYMSRIENGFNPSAMVAAALARGLGCSIDDITAPIAEMAS